MAALQRVEVLPSVTIVFCMVDGAKDWRPGQVKDKRLVHTLIHDTAITTLHVRALTAVRLFDILHCQVSRR